MQEVSLLVINHDVIRMTISQAKDVASHAVASRRPDESVPCLFQLFLPLVRVVCFEMIGHEALDGVISERVEHRVLELYRRQRLSIPYELQVALLAVRAQHLVWGHREIQVICQPDLVHDVDYLEGENVLPEVISVFEYELKLISSRLLIQGGDHQRHLFGAEDGQLVILEIFDYYFRIDADSEQEWELLTPLLPQLLPRLVLHFVKWHPEAVAVTHDALGHETQPFIHFLLNPEVFFEFPAEHQELLEQDIVPLVGHF